MSIAFKYLAVFVLLRCGCACNVLGEDGNVEDTAPLPSGLDLDEMITYLRHDDTRLIRYDVPR